MTRYAPTISFVIVCLLAIFVKRVESENVFGFWTAYIALDTGFITAPQEIGRQVNATGGEDLIAMLGNSATIGIRWGYGNDLLGFSVNLTWILNAVDVQNEFGVPFPFHGQPPGQAGIEARLFPFLRTLAGGRFRPYLSAGSGVMFLSVDLDNIQDQELYVLRVWSAGAGFQIRRKDPDSYFYAEYRRHRISESFPVHSFVMNAVNLGFAFLY